MEREMKFRVWDEHNSDGATMHYTDNLSAYENLVGADYNFKKGYYNNSEGTEIMQFTGLKDRNGADVYEGDILSHTFSDGSIGLKVVRYVNSKGGFCMANVNELKDEKIFDIWSNIRKDYLDEIGFHIVGNIFENPELLNEVK